ncbi:NAD(P)-dependent oxidoreductase [Nocardiopsis oceani]
MRRIGVLGLGGMGSALAESLMAAGYTVRCYDIRPETAEPLLARGAEPATDPLDLAEHSDLVLSFLPGPEQVHAAALDPDHGVLAGLAEGSAMLDMSTCGPDVATTIGPVFTKAGRSFVDCPVSGKAPDMTVLVGGTPGVLGAAEQVLEQVSGAVVHCGRLGAGYATKLLNQHVKYGWYLAAAEALVVARGMGLDAADTATALEMCSGADSGLSTAAEYFRGDVERMRGHAPASTIEKDVALAEAMASTANVRSRTLATLVDFFMSVRNTEYRQRPYPESCELLERLRAMPSNLGDR